jgi:hypothetical protein
MSVIRAKKEKKTLAVVSGDSLTGDRLMCE